MRSGPGRIIRCRVHSVGGGHAGHRHFRGPWPSPTEPCCPTASPKWDCRCPYVHGKRIKMASSFATWQELRAYVLRRDNWTCMWCGDNEAVTYHVDHIYPFSKGGKNTLRNLVCACQTCNVSKHARVIPDEWVPVAECAVCGSRAHPKGNAKLGPSGPEWTCWVCQSASETFDLRIEELAWFRLEFGDELPPEIKERFRDLIEVS